MQRYLLFTNKKFLFQKIYINLRCEKLNILTMQNKKFILTALAAATLSVSSIAQTDTTNLGNSKVKGPYITNSIGSNWFLGIGAGLSLFQQKNRFFL